MARPVCFLVDTDAEIMGTYYNRARGTSRLHRGMDS